MLIGKISSWCVVALVAISLADSSAWGAVGDVLFEDDFSALDPAYEGAMCSVSDGTLKYPVDKNLYSRVLYQASLFSTFDVSAKVRLEKPDAEADAKIGIAFWAMDMNTFYAFRISDYGTYSVASVTPTKWTHPITWRKSSAIKKDPGEWNELRVVAVGNRAVLFINGEKVAVLKGKPPAEGSVLGVYRESYKEASLGYFSAFKVAEPDDKIVPNIKEDPKVILRDDFAELDAAWGAPSNACDVKEGALVLTMEPSVVTRRNHGATEVSGDVDVSAKISLSGGDDKKPAGAGLTFFESASDDFWVVLVSNEGQYAVAHWVKTRWLFPVSYRKLPDDVKWSKGEPIDLKISIRGKKLAVSANGKEVVQVGVQLPKDPWQIGVFGENGTIRFKELMVMRADAK